MRYSIKEYNDIKRRVSEMDVDELLRCVICPNYQADQTPAKNTATFMLHPTDARSALRILSEANSDRADKALVTVDMEFGAGGALKGATIFPSMRAAAEAGDDRLAYDMGVTAATEAVEAGYS